MAVTEVYTKVTENIDKVNLLRGGARSSKTYSLLQMTLKWLITGKLGDRVFETKDKNGRIIKSNKGIALVARATFPSLRRSAYREWVEMLYNTGYMSFIEWRKTTYEFIFENRTVLFLSLDQESKVLGLETTFFWLNESTEIEYSIFKNLILRTRFACFIDYNPTFPESWIKTELEEKRMKKLKDVSLTVSTYHNNPFIGEEMRREIESLKLTDPELYAVFARGEWVKTKGRIFPSFELVDDLPTSFDKEYAGLDFGYSNDPTSLLQVRQVGKELYLKEHLYKTGLLNTDIIEYIRNNLYGIRIIADNAEQKSIEEMRRARIRVKAAWKGRDSILQGIQFVKQHKIFVTKDSLNLQHELKNYKYQKDKDGNYINRPEDANNHLCDALRYCVQAHSKVIKIKIV